MRRPSINRHKQTNKDGLAILLLTTIAVVTHFNWLFNFSVFTSGDWQFISQAQYLSFVHFSPIWVTVGFGGTSATPAFYLVRFLEGLLTLVGSNFSINEKLFFFLPIIFIGTFGTYLFLRQYFKEWLSSVGVIVFTFNTALLFNYAGALTIAVADSLTPLSLYLFRQYLLRPEEKKLMYLCALVFSIISFYELRITLLAMGLAACLLVFEAISDEDGWRYIKGRIKPLANLSLVMLGLQAFWLIPYAIGSRSGVTFSDALGRGLFVSFSDVQNALTLQHPFWTDARPATFVVQAIPLYAWAIPIIAFSGFIFWRQNKNKEIAFWAFVALLGIFLVKQVNLPFVIAYPWIFGHIPGFAAFREASKFYLFVMLGYAVLIPYSLSGIHYWLGEQKKIILSERLKSAAWIAISCVTVCLFLVNAKPLITGKFSTNYAPHHMPGDYVALQSFINKQPDFFRVLWVPIHSRWGVQSNNHPTIDATSINQGIWLTYLSSINQPASATLRDKSLNIFSQPSSNAMLDAASIKYVVVPIRDTGSADDFFKNYGDDRQYFINSLDQISYLKRLNIGKKDLVVYENTSFHPYFAASPTMLSLNVAQDTSIDSLYQFATKKLSNVFSFVLRSKTTNAYPQTKVDDLFQDLLPQDVQAQSVSKTVKTLGRSALFTNVAARDVSYVINRNRITFYSRPLSDILVNGKAVLPASGPNDVLGSADLAPGVNYYLGLNNAIFPMKIDEAVKDLGLQNGPIALYGVTGRNTVPDFSFEHGLWQTHPQDCNGYDNNGIYFMNTEYNDATNGSKSLEFDVNVHTACTSSPSIPISGDKYMLAMDYRVRHGQKAGYEIIFNDPNKTVLRATFNGANAWNTKYAVVTVPKGATKLVIRLLGYPAYQYASESITNYDNVRLVPIATLASIADRSPAFNESPLPSNSEVTFTYTDSNGMRGENLIANGSFAHGLWRKKVSDCDDYDNKPEIGMSLIGISNGRALQLKSRRHTACTGMTNIAITQDSNYLLSFNYRSPNKAKAGYSVSFNDPQKTTIASTILNKGEQWNVFTKQIRAPYGATQMSISVFAYGSSGSQYNIDDYANFSLRQLPISTGQYFIVNEPLITTSTPRQVTFDQQSGPKDSIRINGASRPFYLTMSASYNPLWRLEVNNRKIKGTLHSLSPFVRPDAVPAADHIELNDFENAWYVDPAQLCKGQVTACQRNADGSYNLQLVAEFTPQRWFYLGAVISGITFLGCIGYLGFTFRSRKRKKVYHARV